MGNFECVFVGERDAQAEVSRFAGQFLPETLCIWATCVFRAMQDRMRHVP